MDSGVANEVEVEYVEEVGEGKKIMVEEENEEKMDSGDGKGTVGVDDGGDPLGAGAEEEEDRVVTESEDEEEPEIGPKKLKQAVAESDEEKDESDEEKDESDEEKDESDEEKDESDEERPDDPEGDVERGPKKLKLTEAESDEKYESDEEKDLSDKEKDDPEEDDERVPKAKKAGRRRKVFENFLEVTPYTVACLLCSPEGQGQPITRNNIKQHIRTKHSVDREFSCQFCGKEFKTKQQLGNHEMERHTKVDTFICPGPGCHKSFASLRALAQHSKVFHNGVRRVQLSHFQCWMCGEVSEKKRCCKRSKRLDEESLSKAREEMLKKVGEDLELESPATQKKNVDDSCRIVLLTKVVIDMKRVSCLKKYFAYFE